MGRIRSRAIRGWRNLWGDGDNAGPQDIDGERGITPVYDVGHAAHWQSRWLKDGWATFTREITHGVGGTQRASLAPTAAFTQIAPVNGAPITDFGGTALWLCRVGLTLTAGALTRAWGVIEKSDADPVAIAAGFIPFYPLFFSNGQVQPNTILAAGPDQLIMTNGNHQAGNFGDMLPVRCAPTGVSASTGTETGDILHFVSVTPGAAIIRIHLHFWAGSDGGPPPRWL